MEKEKLYYFAHPYTVKDDEGKNIHAVEEANFKICCARAGELLKRGYNIYSPISHCHPIHVITPEFIGNNEYKLWVELNKLIIPFFEAIILAPKWETSEGCIEEKRIFEDKKLEVLLYENIIKEGKKT